MKHPLSSAIGAAIFAVAGISAAAAHAVLEVPQAVVGKSYKAVVRITHGCEGSPTVKVTVAIPEGMIGVKPMPKPGWQIAMTKGKYAQSYAFYHGKKLDAGVTGIVWTGTLPDDYYDEFVFSGFIAGELKPGDSLPFVVTQDCEKGQLRWDEIAPPEAAGHEDHQGHDSHEAHGKHLEHPAPLLLLLPKADAD